MSAIVMSVSAEISDASGAAVIADARAGSNGTGFGSPDLDLGNGYDGYLGGDLTWDQNTSDGFASDDLAMGLSTNNVDGSVFSVEGAAEGPISYGSGSILIDHVTIRVGAQAANMHAGLSGLYVSFYNGSQLRETIPLDDFSVDTSETEPTGEKVYTVTPSDADDDSVVIAGAVQFSCTDTNYIPSNNDAFAQYAVFAA